MCACGEAGASRADSLTDVTCTLSVRCNFLISRKNRKYFAEEGEF